jgi:bifunctional DNA-binding transcriptional regulator/antitoxin component of YhaV-PrlF toxin-antitoxin module
MEEIVEIKRNGEIKLPRSVLETLGVKTGDKLELKIIGRKISIESSKDPIKSLRGLVKIDNESAKEIIQSPEFEPL